MRRDKHRLQGELNAILDFVAQLDEVLAGCEVAGPEHNLDFLRRLVAQPAFAAGEMHTGLIEREQAALLVAREMPTIPLMAYNVFTVMDETYWTGYPNAETAPYTDPVPNWANTKYMMVKLKPKN